MNLGILCKLRSEESPATLLAHSTSVKLSGRCKIFSNDWLVADLISSNSTPSTMHGICGFAVFSGRVTEIVRSCCPDTLRSFNSDGEELSSIFTNALSVFILSLGLSQWSASCVGSVVITET